MFEEWRDYPPCPVYQASSLGRVRSKDRQIVTRHGRTWLQQGRVLSPATNKLGRVSIVVSNNGHKRSVQVSHVVAESFIGPREGRLVRHLNDDPADNRVENLAYGTHKDNAQDAIRNGSFVGREYVHGESHGATPLTVADVIEIRKRRASGEIYRTIADDYGVSIVAIYRIAARMTWKEVA